MHKSIFPLFIISLGLITAYVFYAVWHTEEPTLANLTPSSPQKTITEDHSYIEPTLAKVASSADIKNKPKRATVVKDSKTNSIESHTSSFVYETPEEVEEQYEEMIPESYSDTLTQAEAAFAALDEMVSSIEDESLNYSSVSEAEETD